MEKKKGPTVARRFSSRRKGKKKRKAQPAGGSPLGAKNTTKKKRNRRPWPSHCFRKVKEEGGKTKEPAAPPPFKEIFKGETGKRDDNNTRACAGEKKKKKDPKGGNRTRVSGKTWERGKKVGTPPLSEKNAGPWLLHKPQPPRKTRRGSRKKEKSLEREGRNGPIVAQGPSKKGHSQKKVGGERPRATL